MRVLKRAFSYSHKTNFSIGKYLEVNGGLPIHGGISPDVPMSISTIVPIIIFGRSILV